MIEPEHPTEEHLRGRIHFHEAGAEWYTKCDQHAMAAWSRRRVEELKKKLAEVAMSKTTGEGSIQ